MSRDIRQVISGALRRARKLLGTDGGYDKDPREASLLTACTAAPPSLEQRLIVKVLEDPGRLRVDALVGLVSTALYREELRQGSSAADLGLFGSRIFVPDVLRALEAGVGRLWTISSAGRVNPERPASLPGRTSEAAP